MKKFPRNPETALVAHTWAAVAVVIALLVALLFSSGAQACDAKRVEQETLIKCVLDGKAVVGKRAVICVLELES